MSFDKRTRSRGVAHGLMKANKKPRKKRPTKLNPWVSANLRNKGLVLKGILNTPIILSPIKVKRKAKPTLSTRSYWVNAERGLWKRRRAKPKTM